MKKFKVSERRACKVVGQHRSSNRYDAVAPDFETKLVARMTALAEQHPRCDDYHQPSVDLLRTAPGPLLVPITVVVETSFLVERHLGGRAEATYLRTLRTSGLTIDRLIDADLDRIVELVDTYADLPLGAVDASVIAVAERHGATVIATLDRRHFTVVRPQHVSHFELLP